MSNNPQAYLPPNDAGLFHSRVRSPKVKVIADLIRFLAIAQKNIYVDSNLILEKNQLPTPKIRKKTSLRADITIGYYGSMFGYLGYRDLESFAKFNKKLSVKTFHITTDKVPSYSTI